MKQDKTLSYIDKVATEIIEALEKGTAPWIQPWKGSEIRNNAPFNPITGKQYEGINFINLSLQGMALGGDPRWMTYKQAKSLNAQVKKGEKGTAIQYWKFTQQVDKRDEEGKVMKDEQGKPIQETIKLENPKVFYATVFNASQIDGLRPLKEDLGIKEVLTKFNPIEAAEAILKNSQATINHVAGNRASYSPSMDRIQLPLKEQFNSEGDYYATALHELGHWSGHEDRLNRDLSHPFGSIGYAKEELRAEIGSYMLSSKLGIDFNPEQHHAYIDSWVSILEDKPSEIFRASADASKITSFITGLQHQQKAKQTLEENIEITESNTVTQREPFSIMIIGAIEQMQDKELNLETLEHSLPVLTKGVELEEMQTAIIKTQDLLLHEQVDESLKEEIKELVSMLTNIHQNMEEAYAKDQEASLNQSIAQNDQALKERANPLYEEKTFLAVPYQEKEEAKHAGAKWDKEAKSWYAPKGADKSKLQSWSIESQEIKQLSKSGIDTQASALSFKEALEQQGLIIQGEPIMDGKMQRVPVVGDKRGKKSGAYVGYTNGKPAGFIQNHKLGTKVNWKETNQTFNNGLSQENISAQKALNEAKRLERAKEQSQTHEEVAKESLKAFSQAKETDANHPYLLEKRVENYGLRLDENNNLLMPLQDIHGKHWSHQKINKNFKGFAQGGKKEGNFFIIGNQNLAQEQDLIIVEGYATGATIHKATNKTVIVAVDSGNLVNVTHTLDQKYPKATLLVAGDNDKYNELLGKPNIGWEKSLEATQRIGRHFIVPPLTNLEVSVKASDFNDLAKLRGLDTVKELINSALSMAKPAQTALRKATESGLFSDQGKEHQEEQKRHKRELVHRNTTGFSR